MRSYDNPLSPAGRECGTVMLRLDVVIDRVSLRFARRTKTKTQSLDGSVIIEPPSSITIDGQKSGSERPVKLARRLPVQITVCWSAQPLCLPASVQANDRHLHYASDQSLATRSEVTLRERSQFSCQSIANVSQWSQKSTWLQFRCFPLQRSQPPPPFLQVWAA